MSNFYIPEDLFLLVLIRLPVKTVGRFKCVSKSWNHMISSSKFVQLHLQHQYLQQFSSIKITPPIRLLCVDKVAVSNVLDYDGRAIMRPSTVGIETNIAEYYSISGGDEEIGCRIQRIYNSYESHAEGVRSILLGACNGLLCQILTNQTFPGYDDYECEISICNPFTKSSWVLPQSPLFLKGDREIVFSGFGYDDVHDTYKIFLASQRVYPIASLVFHPPDDPVYDYEVYCLRSDNWIRVILDLDFRRDYYIQKGYFAHFNGILINGALHWIIRTLCPDQDQNQTKEDCIFAFDLKADKYNLLQFPKDMNYKNYNLMLSVLNGCLLLYEYHFKNPDLSFDMWMMKDYGSSDSWMKIHISGSQYPTLVSITPVGFLEDDNHRRIKIIYHDGHLLLCYDNVSRQIVNFPAPSADTSHRAKHLHFVPSLVKPQPITYKEDPYS